MTDHAKLIADDVVQRVAELPDRTTDWPEAMLVTADELRAIVIAALIADRPVFWQHAIQECNEAHQALDLKGAPRTKTVARLRGVGEQEITLGLRARIQALTADRAAEPPIPYAAVGETLDETLTRNFPARVADAAPAEGLQRIPSTDEKTAALQAAGHSVLAHKYNDLRECPACGGEGGAADSPKAVAEPLCRCPEGVCYLHPSLKTCGMRDGRAAEAAPPEGLEALAQESEPTKENK